MLKVKTPQLTHSTIYITRVKDGRQFVIPGQCSIFSQQHNKNEKKKTTTTTRTCSTDVTIHVFRYFSLILAPFTVVWEKTFCDPFFCVIVRSVFPLKPGHWLPPSPLGSYIVKWLRNTCICTNLISVKCSAPVRYHMACKHLNAFLYLCLRLFTVQLQPLPVWTRGPRLHQRGRQWLDFKQI